LLFQNRFIMGYLKIMAQLIIVIDLQINQCEVSINLLAFSLLTKVQSQSNFTMPNDIYSFISSPNKMLN